MLTEYLSFALHQATYDLLPEVEGFFGEIPLLPGVWAGGPTLGLCSEELRQVLEAWLVLGLRLGHPLQILAGIDLHASLVVETV